MPAFTPNKNIEQPDRGSFNNDWDLPVNADWGIIDTAFGGNTIINVTGVAAGTIAFTTTQYTPPNITFDGTISGALIYVLPSGVGGMWSMANFTSGAFTIFIGCAGGAGPIQIVQGVRSLVVSDGFQVQLADTSPAAQAQANAEAFATAADATVLSTAETFATNAANTAQANAEAFSANASNLASGTVPNAQLPNVGLMPGVIIQADPGGTPSGPPGTIWLFY